MRGLLVLAALVVSPPAGALEIEWVTVAHPNNAPDTPAPNCNADGCGSVPDVYAIGKYELTNAEYAAFLNAKAGALVLAALRWVRRGVGFRRGTDLRV
jgi:formylglycine-generating enzyme required for sulfatase activity